MSRPPGPNNLVVQALADAAPRPLWIDQLAVTAPRDAADPLSGSHTCDLAVVGGGFTGLWTALLAKQDDPQRDVLVLEAREIGGAASGRNGGFCAASLTHGLANGVARFPGEVATLERLGQRNLDEIEATVARLGIDCDFHRPGELAVATRPHQLAWLAEEAELGRRYGHDVAELDGAAVREELGSPTYLAANWTRDRTALVDPARLADGLRRAAADLGVRFAEHTPVTGLRADGAGVRVRTAHGSIRGRQVALATNGFPAPLRRLRPYVVPVYDYVLATEPLTAGQLDRIGWRHRQGVSDLGNQFHYYRLTADSRIVWGGYDALYYWRNGLRDDLDQRPSTFTTLAEHFFQTFPQLADVRFSHRWGGVIDTSTRFFAFQGTALGSRVAYSLGYTGLGVGASRFGAQVMLDLLDGRDTEATRLRAPQRRPVPFPPEPARWAGITLTRRAMARADRRDGRRGPWLRALDRLGLGFDS